MSARLVGLLVRPTAPPLGVGITVAASFIAAETVLAYMLEKIFPGMPFGVVFLLGVLVVSAGWGSGLAVSTTLVSALIYAFVHLNAYGSILPITAEDWVAIIVFVPIALLANVLAGQARLRAAEANRRREEAEESRDDIRISPKSRPHCGASRHWSRVGRLPRRCSLRWPRNWPGASELPTQTWSAMRPMAAAVLLASHDDRGSQKEMPVGKRFSFDGESVPAMVFRTGRAARRDSHRMRPPQTSSISMSWVCAQASACRSL